MKMMNATEARQNFLKLIEDLGKNPDAVHKVAKHGHPVAVLISLERYEGMLETMDILSDEKLMKQLKKAVVGQKGKIVSLEIMKKRLGLKRRKRSPRSSSTA